ncbi:MAG: 16S rRNA (adenine(1518)-N(6)/adenine(1519)-N(6))-dimethyltransferase RsmA [Granulosicoccaceae bacterium]
MRHQARKRFGQNFLQDQQLISEIISYINPQENDPLVEIGPGLGALTTPLLACLSKLSVVEIDRDLVARLQAKQAPGLTIIEADALQVDWRELAGDGRLRLVGNLPYNIGTPLLLKLAQQANVLIDVHAMLQKEVVDRITAKNGTRSFGRLSVMIQACFEVHTLLDVPPEAFDPPPKVQSAVIRMVPHAEQPSASELASLEAVARLAFANKRKTLRNNLKKYISDEQFSDVGIDPGARAETLGLPQFFTLAKLL